MMRTFYLLLTLIIFTACERKYTNEDLQKLNGYWEISKVVMPDGTEKNYSVNPTIDYFEINDNKGFRKKVMPQVDGSYIVNDLSENVFLDRDVAGDITMNYSTEYAKWKESLLKLDDDELVIKNQNDITYYYTKPQPFTLK